ncbi:hypothetical protein FCN77_03850 [Arthrobacter sp. 24S4-2]|uniref:hypothetical protein n=1 Tax=Arthrobacter sp. 24S4-2 TaxID=2575374 RepID=UPI0010C7BFD6|nr:hypothetical protein [Arthrobacter sp. 24S4-2]QCO97013.1 hypothetical protein FCN77_03850 [Arthrobacter sp. 24S4-2]
MTPAGPVAVAGPDPLACRPHGAGEQDQQRSHAGNSREVEIDVGVHGCHGRAQRIRLRREGQPPHAQEGDGETDEQAGSRASRKQGQVASPGHHLDDAGKVPNGQGPEEREQRRLFKRDRGEHQKAGGYESRNDG